MAKVTVTVCDECGTQVEVRHYEIKEGSRKRIVDLCGTHSVSLDQLLDAGAKGAQNATRARSRASRAARSKVTTMEEIEALKLK